MTTYWFFEAISSMLLEAVILRCYLNKVEARNFIKKVTLAEMFSCEFCEISN